MEVWKIIFLSKLVICRFHVNPPGCKFLLAKAKLASTNKQSATMICLFLCLMGNCWISCGARSDCVAWNCTSTPGYINYSQPTSPNPREHMKRYRNQLGICPGMTWKSDTKNRPQENSWPSYCYVWWRKNQWIFVYQLYRYIPIWSIEHDDMTMTGCFRSIRKYQVSTFPSSTWDLHKASFFSISQFRSSPQVR